MGRTRGCCCCRGKKNSPIREGMELFFFFVEIVFCPMATNLHPAASAAGRTEARLQIDQSAADYFSVGVVSAVCAEVGVGCSGKVTLQFVEFIARSTPIVAKAFTPAITFSLMSSIIFSSSSLSFPRTKST